MPQEHTRRPESDEPYFLARDPLLAHGHGQAEQPPSYLSPGLPVLAERLR